MYEFASENIDSCLYLITSSAACSWIDPFVLCFWAFFAQGMPILQCTWSMELEWQQPLSLSLGGRFICWREVLFLVEAVFSPYIYGTAFGMLPV